LQVQAVWQERMERAREEAGTSSPVLQGTCTRINHAHAFCFHQTTCTRARATTPPHLEQRAAHSRHKHRHALALHERHGGSETQLSELQRRYALLGDCHNFSLFAKEDPPEEAGRGSRVCVAGSKRKSVLFFRGVMHLPESSGASTKYCRGRAAAGAEGWPWPAAA